MGGGLNLILLFDQSVSDEFFNLYRAGLFRSEELNIIRENALTDANRKTAHIPQQMKRDHSFHENLIFTGEVFYIVLKMLFKKRRRKVMGMHEERLGEFVFLPLSLISINRRQMLWSLRHSHYRLPFF
jgi:hypothetical protein